MLRIDGTPTDGSACGKGDFDVSDDGISTLSCPAGVCAVSNSLVMSGCPWKR